MSLFRCAWFLLQVHVFLSSEQVDDVVVTLREGNFDQAIRTHERILVEFFSPFCGHCQVLEPEYKEAALRAKSKGLKVVFAKVDVTTENTLGTIYSPSGIPTLKYFFQGGEVECEGRAADKIVQWLTKKEDASLCEISENEVETFLGAATTNEHSLLAHVKKNSGRAKAYLGAVKNALEDYDIDIFRFGVVWLSSSAHSKNDAHLSMLLPRPEGTRVTFNGTWTIARIISWAKRSTYIGVGRGFKSAKYAPSVLKAMDVEAAVVAVPDDNSMHQDVESVLLSQIEKHPNWVFTVASLGSLADEELDIIGATKASVSLLSVVRSDKKRFVRATPELVWDSTEVGDFLANVSLRKTEPHVKSQPRPEKEVSEQGITIITGHTFNRIVFNEKNDVFVNFYAPWCKHCQNAAPEWVKLAAKSQELGWNNRGIVIASMDITANECEEEVPDYPRFMFYPAVNSTRKMKARQRYSGKYTVDGFADFLTENAVLLEEDSLDGTKHKLGKGRTKTEL